MNDQQKPKIDRFVFVNIPNGTYILHTMRPLVICRVWMFKDIQGLTQQIDKIKPLAETKVHGYNIALTTWYFLNNEVIYHSNFNDELKTTIEEMKEFFIEQRMKPNPKLYERYKT